MEHNDAIRATRRVMPVLGEYIQGKYLPRFDIPGVFLLSDWSGIGGNYYRGKNFLTVTRSGRSCLTYLIGVLCHETGHSLHYQLNPKMENTDMFDGDRRCLEEGVAEVLKDEFLEHLKRVGLFQDSDYEKFERHFWTYLNIHAWLNTLKGLKSIYTQGKKGVKQLMREGINLREIMQNSHTAELAEAIPYSCWAAFRHGVEGTPEGFVEWVKVDRRVPTGLMDIMSRLALEIKKRGF